MTVISGIYCIYFESVDNQYYIGCSVDITKRINEHKAAFIRGNHPNIHMQNIYNKNKDVVFEVLEYCNIENLHNKEIDYINKFDSYKNGYNQTTGGDGGGFGEGASGAKFTEAQYIEVLKLLANTSNTYSTISSITGVSLHSIKKIASLKSHSYLSQKLPEEYAKVVAKFNNRDNSAISKGIKYPNIVSPEGIEYEVTNVHAFAEEHGLQYQNLHKVLTGKRLSHLDWKLCK